MSDCPIDEVECCRMCGAELDARTGDIQQCLASSNSNTTPTHAVRLRFYRCPRCHVGGEIVRHPSDGDEITRRGPAVSERSARSYRHFLEDLGRGPPHAGGGFDAEQPVDETGVEAIPADGGRP